MADNSDVKIIENKICISTRALLDILKIAKSTLSDWESKGCPKVARGWWAIEDVLTWRGLVSSSGIKTEEDIENLSLQDQKLAFEIKWKQAQAEAVEFKNAIAQGDYIPKEDIVAELSRFFIVLKKSLTTLSRKIGTEVSFFLDPEETRRLEHKVNNLILDALEQMSVDGVYSSKKTKRKVV
jgi:phage terminase Nu1 subunit (DNA packaging protein)